MRTSFILFSLCLFIGCSPSEKDLSEYKAQILKAEKDFEAAAKKDGLASAFSNYADSSAVMSRGKLIHGKDSIYLFYEKTPSHVKLSWTPDFVDVSKSGDLGYTYGKYVYESVDSTGAPIISRGTFHTVWKRQSDGSWKFVWD